MHRKTLYQKTLYARKSLLFLKDKRCEKTTEGSVSDVTMGSYSLTCLHKISGPASDKIRKITFDLCTRRYLPLSMSIETNPPSPSLPPIGKRFQ